VIFLRGKELASQSPATSKADLDKTAEGAVAGAPVEAAAAALAGLAL
jgi:hypothetical protein